MNIAKKLSLSENTRKIITYIMYVIFAGYTIYMAYNEPTIEGKISYIILMSVILFVALWAEYLRYIYKKMISSLVMEGSLENAQHFKDQLIKKDFFKSYKNTLYIFDTLYLQDSGDMQTCITIVETQDKFFRSSLDCLLIRNYTLFYSYYRLNDIGKVKKYYPEVIKLKGTKIKGNKVSPLYQWDFIDGIFLLATKEYKKAYKTFKNLNTQNMNQRELAQYYLAYAKTCIALQETKKAESLLHQVIACSNVFSYAKEAEALLPTI